MPQVEVFAVVVAGCASLSHSTGDVGCGATVSVVADSVAGGEATEGLVAVGKGPTTMMLRQVPLQWLRRQ